MLLVAALLRGTYLAELVHAPDFASPALDAAFHDYWARGLALGDWLLGPEHADPQINSTPYFRPPGYPFFLALVYGATGGSYLAARLVQVVLGLGGCVLAWALGRRVFDAGTGLLAALLLACHWAPIYFEGELLEPALLSALLLALLYVAAGWRERLTWANSLTVGVWMGLAALVRPNVLACLPVMLAWAFACAPRGARWRRGWRPALLFLVGVAAAIAPVTIRNYRVARDFVLISSNGGINFYIGNNETADGLWPRVPGLGDIIGRGGWTSFDHARIVAGVERTAGRSMRHSEVSRYFARKGWEFIRTHPGRTLQLLGKKAVAFWGPAEISNNKVLALDKEHSAVLRYLPGFPPVAALFLMGLLAWGLERRWGAGALPAGGGSSAAGQARLLIVAFVLVYFASFLPFFVAGRYRVPLMPLLLLLGACGLRQMVFCFRARRLAVAAMLLIVGVGGYLAAQHPWVRYEPDRAWWHLQRAEADARQGRTESSIAELRAASACDPQSEVVYYKLGLQLAAGERHREAVEALLKAVDLKPAFAEAHQALGISYGMLDDPEQAAAHYREAIRLAPRLVGAHYNLGIVLAHLGRFDEAVETLEHARELARQAGRSELEARIDARLEQFRARIPPSEGP